MTSVTTKPDSPQPTGETAVYLFDNWFDPIEGGLRDRVREFIHAMIEGELDMALSRPRYARHAKSPSGEAEETVGVTGHRHGHRSRSLMGSFGRVEYSNHITGGTVQLMTAGVDDGGSLHESCSDIIAMCLAVIAARDSPIPRTASAQSGPVHVIVDEFKSWHSKTCRHRCLRGA